MTKLPSFKATATEKDCQNSLRIDEITLHGTAEAFRAIGIFFINAAHEMDLNDTDHVHLQDSIKNFSSKKHCDIILVNEKIINNL
ncbi:Imm32 family immunity protein [Acidovorax sp. NCPPB 3576]|uniref:Imm32 family immunity protein n=1 Tax=Acidovorax sp. NCPPB 3576 TaxID=2940488 RepID=UPI003FA4A76A